jgi:hypothetical protein
MIGLVARQFESRFDMNGIRCLGLATLVASTSVFATEPPIDFYFANEAMGMQHEAATAQWFAKCANGGEFARFADGYAPDARMALDERKSQGAKFDEMEFTRIATDTWRKANAALPQGPLRICVDMARVADTFTRDRMGGIVGVTAGHGRIILRIHPDAAWQSVLPYALAHEMHHSYWAEHHYDPAKPFTLADYMVFEGRADYFAGTLFNHPAPWTTALSDDDYAATWRELSKTLGATDGARLRAAMFGSPQAGIPMWAGYSIGHDLVAKRMSHAPALDLKAMTAAPASEFMPPVVP